MSELPPGFVLDQPQIPQGFQLDGQPQQQKQFGLGDTWPARLAKSIYSGLTLPGDVYQGKATVPHSANMGGQEDTSSLGRVVDLAGIAAPINPAARAGDQAIAGAARGGGMVPPKAPTADALYGAAERGYSQAREMPLDIHPDAVKAFTEAMYSTLGREGIDETIAPKTFATLGKIANPPGSGVFTGANLESLRKGFGHTASDFNNPTDKLAATRSIRGLDEFIENIPPQGVLAGDAAAFGKTVKEARGNYAAASRSDDVTGAAEIAERNAAVANSGQNLDNATRQRFNSILKSDKSTRGYSTEELAQMELIARGNRPRNYARSVGNFLGGGGGLGAQLTSAIGLGVGGAIGNWPGAALGAALGPSIGVGSRAIANALAKRSVNRLDESTRKRSPLYETMQPEVMQLQDAKRAALVRLLLGAQEQ